MFIIIAVCTVRNYNLAHAVFAGTFAGHIRSPIVYDNELAAALRVDGFGGRGSTEEP